MRQARVMLALSTAVALAGLVGALRSGLAQSAQPPSGIGNESVSWIAPELVADRFDLLPEVPRRLAGLSTALRGTGPCRDYGPTWFQRTVAIAAVPGIPVPPDHTAPSQTLTSSNVPR
jgi:hypothetical protein